MNGKTPHLVQYQGSKRILAPQILQYLPLKFDRLVEPFSGMAAISIAVAKAGRTDKFWINDLNAAVVNLLRSVVNDPELIVRNYRELWSQQFEYEENHIQHFNKVRDEFNSGNDTPTNMLYLLARCVKGAVRYGKDGKFNQSADKRRHGTKPKNLEENAYAISTLLKGKTEFSSFDYHDVFDKVHHGDIVYMDPPYQGVTNARDNRYYSGVPFSEFTEALEILNRKNVDYLISYDGTCGGKEYGEELPKHLGCKKVLLNAGPSSQATLLGKRETTFEALYISANLISCFNSLGKRISMMEMIV